MFIFSMVKQKKKIITKNDFLVSCTEAIETAGHGDIYDELVHSVRKWQTMQVYRN